ncbi:MAG: acyl-CoA dehydrogenase, partial [Acidobacteria bacterium]
MEKRYLRGGEFLITPMEESEIFLREELPAEVLEIGATANRFMREKVVPNIKEIDGHNFELLVSLLKEAGELGLFSIDVPEEYEGLGMDKKTAMYVAEQMGLEASFLTAYA